MKGSIEHLPSGRYRARQGKRTVGTYDTLEQAQAALGGATIGSWWPAYIVRRRRIVRDWVNEESRFELYFANEPIARVPFPELTRRHARLWLDGMMARGLAPQTIRNAMNLGRGLCADVLEAELLTLNPFTGVKVPRTYGRSADDSFTVLDPDEQIALLDATDDDEYHMVAFALHTGLRSSELWNLRFEDIDLTRGWVHVRRGKAGITKTGKARRLPIIGLARQALEWAFANRRCDFVWPSPKSGDKRFDSSQPHRWHGWVKAAGIKRRVRFYDLRHTCATALLAGWWGGKWALDDVQQMLGHASAKMTERYAHLVDDSLKRAAAGTSGLVPTAWDENSSRLRDLNSRPTVYEGGQEPSAFVWLGLRRSHERFGKSRENADRVGRSVLVGLELAFALARGERGARGKLHSALVDGALALSELEAAREG